MNIKAEHLMYVYEAGTGYEKRALDDVTCEIKGGEFIGLIGHTGSGKSTFIQHLNGLLKAHSGDIKVDDVSIYSPGYNMIELRSNVGLVFQYPEHQLFESDVLKDVCFGPRNLGASKEEAEVLAKEALASVNLGSERFYKASPFDLSGGQKRRAAIAGVLAMKPKVLILDETTAGLDPKGREEILGLISQIHKDLKITVILVSHSMEDVANYVDRLLVMDKGVLAFDGTPKEVFRHYKELEKLGLAAPQVTYCMNDLKAAGMDVDTDAITISEAVESIMKNF